MRLIWLFITICIICFLQYFVTQIDSVFQPLEDLLKAEVKYINTVEDKIDKYSNRNTSQTPYYLSNNFTLPFFNGYLKQLFPYTPRSP